MVKKLLFIACLLPGIALSQNASDVNFRSSDSIAASRTIIPGGWTTFRTDIDRGADYVFRKAFEGFFWRILYTFRCIYTSSDWN